ncbi:MAG: terpene cyclase/mutase family protein [Pirellulales bacterium]|nr:terpene cyclase/mutase family protein [Pirellulales bacterium]
MNFRHAFRTWWALFSTSLWLIVPAWSAESIGPDPATYRATVDRALGYLRSSQSPDGSFSSFAGPGVTALVTTALLHHGRQPSDPMVARGLAYLEGFVHEDGGVYQQGTFYQNYETCLAIVCFTAANQDGRYHDLLKKAEAFVRGIQWDEGEGHDPSSTSFGGSGYGKHKRPDLSNTSFLIDALKETGAGPDDPAFKKALAFVSRCQNLETEHNTTPWAVKNPDGGFYYTAAAGGLSQAGETETGGLRSYGSMTYAGLKSMIYAGVGPDDPRVQAAFLWAKNHYTLTENPGIGSAGLYYYYHTFAKALDAMEATTITDSNGRPHDWRRELAEELARAQKPDGSWVNSNSRWLEGDPNLVTAYCLLALAYCQTKEIPFPRGLDVDMGLD